MRNGVPEQQERGRGLWAGGQDKPSAFPRYPQRLGETRQVPWSWGFPLPRDMTSGGAKGAVGLPAACLKPLAGQIWRHGIQSAHPPVASRPLHAPALHTVSDAPLLSPHTLPPSAPSPSTEDTTCVFHRGGTSLQVRTRLSLVPSPGRAVRTSGGSEGHVSFSWLLGLLEQFPCLLRRQVSHLLSHCRHQRTTQGSVLKEDLQWPPPFSAPFIEKRPKCGTR